MKATSKIKCSNAQKLMSPYIDSMAEPEESERLESHLETCEPCQRQLQSYISLRSMMARIEPVRPPEDLVLDTRVKLSHARSGGWFDRMEGLLNNVLKPVVVPAASAIVLTVLSFSIIFGQVALDPRFINLDSAVLVMDLPVQATDKTLFSNVARTASDLGESTSVQASVDSSGLVYGIKILGGNPSPAAVREINDMLYPARFKPATRSGKPVNSTTIISWVNVRS